MSERQRDIHWTPWDKPGAEHLRLAWGEDGLHADGLILLHADDRDHRIHYRVEADADWRFRRLHIALLGTQHALHIEADEAGDWQVNRQPAPELAGCIDPDIQVTPFTNTLPIRRLELGEGEGAEITVAYVRVPELSVEPLTQRYTCLKALGAQDGLYRYESAAMGDRMAADLPVDEDGLVLDYPESFRRTWPR